MKGIGYTDGVITGVEIKNQASGKICFKWGEIKEEAPDKPEQPDDEPPEVKPINQDAPGTVSTSDKLPKQAQTLPTVINFIRNEISDIQETMGIAEYDEAKKQVVGMADELAKSGSLPKKPNWKSMSMDEAKNVFAAIRKFIPAGGAA